MEGKFLLQLTGVNMGIEHSNVSLLRDSYLPLRFSYFIDAYSVSYKYPWELSWNVTPVMHYKTFLPHCPGNFGNSLFNRSQIQCHIWGTVDSSSLGNKSRVGICTNRTGSDIWGDPARIDNVCIL